MTIYITPFDLQNDVRLNIKSTVNLFEVYYKTDKGPLGFNIDEKGRALYRSIVSGNIWYSRGSSDFYVMDVDSLAKNPWHAVDGVFLQSTQFIDEEIAKEKELRLTIIKNQPRRKYSKPLLEEVPSFFTDFYNKKERKHTEHKIDTLFNLGMDIAIGANNSLGSHFIMKQDSVFMNRLISSCKELDIAIKHVKSDADVPAW